VEIEKWDAGEYWDEIFPVTAREKKAPKSCLNLTAGYAEYAERFFSFY
jgi:hypothetical protein